MKQLMLIFAVVACSLSADAPFLKAAMVRLNKLTHAGRHSTLLNRSTWIAGHGRIGKDTGLIETSGYR